MKKVYEIKLSVEGKAFTDPRSYGSGCGDVYSVYGSMECSVVAETEKEAMNIVMGYDFAGDFCEEGWEEVTNVTITDIKFIGDATPLDENEFVITDTGLDDDYDDSDDRYEMRKINEYLNR